MLTTEALLGKGYFPRELPHPFTTEPLANLYAQSAGSLALGGGWTECARHNLARLGGSRRPLMVPNPRSYIALAEVLQKHWKIIDEHLKSQSVALSRPVVTQTAARAVRPHVRLGEGPVRRARLWRGQHFILRADVSQFYGSLYTHAIPWALHTKKVAKSKMRKTEGDEIDAAVRACSSGQTSGIPIGPDTSLVVAEIVMTAVDAAFSKKVKRLRAFRYLDDYEVAFRSRAEAEEALAHLENALADYELVANPVKTVVLELPQPFHATWTGELARFPIRTSEIQRLNDAVDLFSRAAELAAEDPLRGAFMYVLRRSREIDVSRKMWGTFQSLVWSAVSVEPTTMAVALDLLSVKANQAGSSVAKAGAREVIESLIERHAPLRNASEVAWALWAAIQLGVDLSAKSGKAVSKMEDDFVALLALDAHQRGRLPTTSLKTGGWESMIKDPQVMHGDHWLLAYEASVRGWLSGATKSVAGDVFFNELQKADVHFYDEHPPRAPFTGPAGPLPGVPSDEY